MNLKKFSKMRLKTTKYRKKENKDIINIFLNNVKEPIQKRELPKIPIVPAFINKLPDAVNNKIFHYVGYKSKLSKMMAYPIRNIPIYLRDKQERTVSYVCRLYCNTLDMNTKKPIREKY